MMRRITTIFLIGMLVFAMNIGQPAHADSDKIDQLKDQISDITTSQEQLEKDIKQLQKKISTTHAKKTTLQGAIDSINTSVDAVAANIALTKNKISAAELIIKKLRLEVEHEKTEIEKNRTLIANNIRTVDQKDHESLVEIMLKNDNIADFWEKLDDLNQFQKELKVQISNLEKLRLSAEQKQEKQKNTHQELLSYQSSLSDQRMVLHQTKEQKSLLLKKTSSEESAYQSSLQEKLARKKQFQSQLDQLESQLKVALDPSKLPSSGSQVLSWPVPSGGTIGITQRFGRTVAAQRLYTSGSHSGLDIAASMGTPITAAADGVVKGAENTDLVCKGASYGKFVFIKHDNGLATIYGHLSVIKASVGEHVKRGQLIGYSGATGYVTGPHLHFGVYASQAVKMTSFASSGCPGATYHMPVAPHKAYLAPLEYLAKHQLHFY